VGSEQEPRNRSYELLLKLLSIYHRLEEILKKKSWSLKKYIVK
jgi:hypothetical protein